jgi:hypothetical protein
LKVRGNGWLKKSGFRWMGSVARYTSATDLPSPDWTHAVSIEEGAAQTAYEARIKPNHHQPCPSAQLASSNQARSHALRQPHRVSTSRPPKRGSGTKSRQRGPRASATSDQDVARLLVSSGGARRPDKHPVAMSMKQPASSKTSRSVRPTAP